MLNIAQNSLVSLYIDIYPFRVDTLTKPAEESKNGHPGRGSPFF
jgi:hypothetical protein